MTTVLVILAVLVAVILVLAARKPDEFRLSRSIVIHAPASTIFARINDLKAWDAWSPWAKLDPNSTVTFTGPAKGVGTAMAWDGNNKVGKGRMEIVESQPPHHLRIRLDFEKPMKGMMYSIFTLNEQDGGTQVTWASEGPNNFMGKIFSVFVNCEKMMAKMYDQGLASLKRASEPAGLG